MKIFSRTDVQRSWPPASMSPTAHYVQRCKARRYAADRHLLLTSSLRGELPGHIRPRAAKKEKRLEMPVMGWQRRWRDVFFNIREPFSPRSHFTIQIMLGLKIWVHSTIFEFPFRPSRRWSLMLVPASARIFRFCRLFERNF